MSDISSTTISQSHAKLSFGSCIRYNLIVFIVLVLSISPIHQAFASTIPEKPPRQTRVLLTSFQDQNQLRIGIYGSYTMNDYLSFQRGSQLSISVIEGSLQVHYQGMTYLAGNSIHLVRHQAEEREENGLRLGDQLNLFPGDLLVKVQDNCIYPILSIPVEDYLQGVVPYEMADEFPLEALKAQAIAARTYTIAHLKPDREYDLVDNTNDQVFRGLNISKINAIRAVTETAGLVCVYGGKLVNAFYTASNGGMTESAYNAWGREKIPYLSVQKDPFDIENPQSIMRTAQIYKDFTQSINTHTQLLRDYLLPRVSQRLNENGYDLQTTSFEITGLDKIVAHTGKYTENQGVMSYLRFDLLLTLEMPDLLQADDEIILDENNEIEALPLTQVNANRVKKLISISLDCPVFPDVEQLLSLSINKNQNEIVIITEDETSFMISFARYGHGVGLSQRGAEWMAGQYGWNYEQILRFYYPGSNLQRLDTQSPALQRIQYTYLATPGPIPTDTPRPTLMPQTQSANESQRIVYVTGIDKNSSLNMRQLPDYLSEILARLYYGQELLVLQTLENGWLQVKTDVLTGYVREEYVGNNKGTD